MAIGGYSGDHGNHMTSASKENVWVGILIVTVLLSIILSFSFNYWYANQTERKAIEAGYCHVQNVAAQGFYHWEKCSPATAEKAKQ